MLTDAQYILTFCKMKLCLKLLLLQLFLFIQIDNTLQKCDYKFSNGTNSWFKFHEIPAIWSDARLRCSLEGGILASPVTKDILSEMAYILQSIPGLHTRRVFTGLHSTFSKGEYYSVNGTPLYEFEHYWENDEPDNKGNAEQCLTMNGDGDLADVSCGSTYPYICIKAKPTMTLNICGTEDSNYTLDSTTQKCYKFHTVPRNFSRAHFACSAEGAHLAIINSQDEANAIKNLFAKNPASSMKGNFWKDFAFIGFHDWGEGADLRTIHGQTLEEAGFDKFSPGEPNKSAEGENCGSVYRSGLMNDLWCEKHYAFICERDMEYPVTCDPVKYNLYSSKYQENTTEVPEVKKIK